MRLLLILLGLVNGVYMLADGIFVMIKGKFIGPDKPGPWAELFYRFDIDVFALGPLFAFFGLLWLIWVYAFWANLTWYNVYGIAISFLTLWYLPIGTLLSILIIVMLYFSKQRNGS